MSPEVVGSRCELKRMTSTLLSLNDRGGAPVSDDLRGGANGGGAGDGVAKFRHAGGEFCDCFFLPNRAGIARTEHPVGGVADRFVAGGFKVFGGRAFVVKDSYRGVIVGSPGVIHRSRAVEKIPRMDGGRGEIPTNGREAMLIPDTGDGIFGLGLSAQEDDSKSVFRETATSHNRSDSRPISLAMQFQESI